ncbi:MAG: hypothetical protein ACI4K7_04150, partial [Oscillospiraceae bacterium]
QDGIIRERMTEELILKYISGFAERYPEEFLKQELTDNADYVVKALHRSVFRGLGSAEIMLRLLEEKSPYTYNSELLNVFYSAIFSEDQSFLEHLMSLPIRLVSYITLNEYIYLSDSGRYDILDRIFTGASRDDISAFLKKTPTLMDIVGQRSDIEYIYEAAGYIEGCRSSDELAYIVNDLLEEMDMSVTFSYGLAEQLETYSAKGDCMIVRSWRFMKEHGLKFRDLKYFLNFETMEIGRKQQKLLFSLMKEHLVPVLADKVYITIWYYLLMEDEHRDLFLRLADVIKGRRIILDCSEYAHDQFCNSRDGTAGCLIRLLKKGPDVIIADDPKSNDFAVLLLENADLLECMLKVVKLTDEQIDSLIDICTEKVRPGALNVIRKYMNRLDR